MSSSAVNTTKNFCRLAIAVASIAIIWLAVLPILASQPIVSEHIASQKQQGIDPSALFYTELEIASGIARHVEQLNAQYPEKFWASSDKKH